MFIVLHCGPESRISYETRWSSIESRSIRRIFCTRQEKVDKPPVLPRVDNCHTYVNGKRAYPLNEFGAIEAGELGDSRWPSHLNKGVMEESQGICYLDEGLPSASVAQIFEAQGYPSAESLMMVMLLQFVTSPEMTVLDLCTGRTRDLLNRLQRILLTA